MPENKYPENDVTLRIDQGADWQVPEKYADRVVDGGRKATVEEALAVASMEESPITVWLGAVELVRMKYERATPYEFMQSLLAAFKAAGAPVEGRDTLRLAHGRIAKAKPDPARQERGFKYLWLPTQHCEVLFGKGGERA